MTLRRLFLIAIVATASASHQSPPLLAVSRLRGGAGASSAPTALTKPKSHTKRPLSLIADAAAKFTLPKEAEIAIGAAGIFLSYSVLAVQQENVYAAQFGAILNAIQFSKDSLSHL